MHFSTFLIVSSSLTTIIRAVLQMREIKRLSTNTLKIIKKPLLKTLFKYLEHRLHESNWYKSFNYVNIGQTI